MCHPVCNDWSHFVKRTPVTMWPGFMRKLLRDVSGKCLRESITAVKPWKTCTLCSVWSQETAVVTSVALRWLGGGILSPPPRGTRIACRGLASIEEFEVRFKQLNLGAFLWELPVKQGSRSDETELKDSFDLRFKEDPYNSKIKFSTECLNSSWWEKCLIVPVRVDYMYFNCIVCWSTQISTPSCHSSDGKITAAQTNSIPSAAAKW